MSFAPIDYGPQVQPDNTGIQALESATAQHQAVFAEAKQLGNVVEGGAAAITQGILHTQSLKATAAVKESQASTLQFIDSNPYVPKAVLQQRMKPEDYTAWEAGLGQEYKDKLAVPMFTAAGALFDSEAQQAREKAGSIISLPGWRGSWDASERSESSTIRERYVNRLAADQMISDQRSQTLTAVDTMVDSATSPADFETAAKFAETSQWLKPAERRFAAEKTRATGDSFVATQAMTAGDTDVMKVELDKLKSANAAELFPHLNPKQRLGLEQQLTREYGFKAAKDVADKQIVGPNVDPDTGKPDDVKIDQDLTAYKGADKPAVEKAVLAQRNAVHKIWEDKQSELQKQIYTAGQDPATGDFNMQTAMQNPAARKAAAALNADSPQLLGALRREDMSRENAETRSANTEQRAERAQHISNSAANLVATQKFLDDPTNSVAARSMTRASFESQLFDNDMTRQDRDTALKSFDRFTKNGGKPDERPGVIVKSELLTAAKGDNKKAGQLAAQYGDALEASAHAFIRANPDMPPDKMTDALRTHTREEMLSGTVVGSGRFFDSSARRIDWENKPEFAGKNFKQNDGTITPASEQPMVQLTRGGKTVAFPAVDAVAARVDGWK